LYDPSDSWIFAEKERIMHVSQRNLRNLYLVTLIVLAGSLTPAVGAESFVAPASGTLYIKCIGGSAGAVSQFGTGSAISNFVPLLNSLPQACPTTEVSVGPVTAGQRVPFGIHTVWEDLDYWAFSTSSDQPSTVAFSDVYNSLGMGGRVIQQTGVNTWTMHLSDAAHHTVALDMANNVLIQIRLVVDDPRAPSAAPVSGSNVEAISGSWSASFTDTKASGHLNLNLMQNPDGEVVGTYTSSMGGAGRMKGQLTGIDFRFELTQTVEGCSGTYRGTGTRNGDHISGSYTGTDCLGDRGNGTFTMAKGDIAEARALTPLAAAPAKDVGMQTPQRPVNGLLTVTAIGYRVIPHFRTMSYQVPGRSNTTCYGSGTYLGNTATATADCSTVTTLPQERQTTIGYIEIYNQVEANGMVYTLRCTRSWTGSNCSWFVPGHTFGAEIKDTTMWITAHRGGNLGKEIHAKYQLLDVRPRSGTNQ
jgi:hypothetical protein